MSDFLQTNDGDIAIVNNTASFVEGADEVAQRMTQRLRTFLGEWFLNQEIGVPYLQEVMKKNPNNTIVESVFKREIMDTPGVIGIDSFNISVDNATRVMTLTVKAKSTAGKIKVEVTL
jgi:hypothetical protein